MSELILHVRQYCKPGMAEMFVRAVKEQGIQQKVREEDGCLQYDFMISCEEADTVMLLERWTSAEAQQIHMTQPHMAKLWELKEKYVVNTVLERFE